MRREFVTPIDLPLLLFLASVPLALLPAYDRSLAWASLTTMLSGGLACLIAIRVLPSSKKRPAQVIAVLSGLAALYLLIQYTNNPALEKIAVIDRIAGFIGQITPRLGDWSPMPNSMATFVEGLLFLPLALLWEDRKGKWRWLWLACAGIIALALFLSASRGAWLGIVVAGLVWLALHHRWARVLLVAAGAVFLGLLLAVVISGDIQILGRIPLVDRILAPLFIRPDRLDVYRGSLTLIEDAPFTGIGLGGQFAMVYSRFYLLLQVPFLTYSHNFYLETWLELGLLGFAALVWLLVSVVWSGVAAAPRRASLSYRGTGPANCGTGPACRGTGLTSQAAWIGLLAMAIHGFTDARPYVDLWCWVPFFLLLALHGAAWRGQEERDRAASWLGGPAVIILAALALIAVALPLDQAAWVRDQAGRAQVHAELTPGLSDGEREALREQAEAGLRQSIALRPGQRSARTRLGLLLCWDQRMPEALSELRAAYQEAPDNPLCIKVLGLVEAWNGNLERAAALLSGVSDIINEMNTWAYAWLDRDRADLARNALKASLLLDPDQPEVEQVLEWINEE